MPLSIPHHSYRLLVQERYMLLVGSNFVVTIIPRYMSISSRPIGCFIFVSSTTNRKVAALFPDEVIF
jgi:hypothetical protein